MLRDQSFWFTAFFLFVVVLFLPVESYPQSPYLPSSHVEIRHLSVDQGLSSRLIRSITQDSKGFMWIGTDLGVNRYDGNRFQVIHWGTDSSTISDPSVWGGVCADTGGVVWVGTSRGLNRFDPSTQSFKKYFHERGNPASLSSDSINCIYIDRNYVLWVGTGRGLNRFDKHTETWTRYYPSPGLASRPGDNYISQILEDREGTFWIAAGGGNDQIAGGGVFNFDRRTGKFRLVGPGSATLAIFEDRQGQMWAGVNRRGLCRIDRSTSEFISVPLPPRDLGGGIFQGIKGICEDNGGHLWMATNGWTLLRYDKHTESITRFSNDPHNPESISAKNLTTTYASKDGIVWVGTDRAGLNTVSTKPFNHLHYLGTSLQLAGRVDLVFEDNQAFLWVGSLNGLWRFNSVTGQSACILPKGLVRHMLQDDRGIIWIGDRYSIYRFDPKTNRLKTAWEIPVTSGFRDRIVTIAFDSEKRLWVGGNSELFRLSKDMRKYQVFPRNLRDPRGVTSGQVESFAQDSLGRFWVSTYEGVNRFDRETGTFTRFTHNDADSTSISNGKVNGLLIDRKGRIWIGTNGGLNRFDEKTGSFKKYSLREPGLGTAANSLEEDARGNIWFAWRRAVFKFDPETESFTWYDRSDGIEDVEILSWSHARIHGGELAYGTIDGLLVFHPDSLRKSAFIPPIVITGIKKLNKEIRTSCMPELVRKVSFTHKENVFSISFSALSYDMPEYNQYAYKLEGFDKEWIYCGNTKEATYTNLDPGTYTFKVKGSNHDRVWNERGASLQIIVLPPWWRAWWAYILYGFAIFVTGYCTWMLQLRRVRTRHALEMTKFEALKLQEIDELKSHFFTNISHEFRTPLTLILGPVKQIAERVEDEKTKEELGLVHRNARKLLTLVNQLLDISKIESGNMKLQVSPLDMNRLLKNLVVSFTPHAERKKITLKFTTTESAIPAYVDKEKFESIVTNVLSNAFKFTPEAGLIELNISRDDHRVNIRVSDTGIGIPKEKLARIFDRFYQVDGTHTREQEGTGIGLALTKELVDLHKGTIAVESVEGKGTVVTVSIPLGKKHLRPDEIVEQPESHEDEAVTELASVSSEKPHQSGLIDKVRRDSNRPIVLLVEDNSDVRYYIRENIEDDYCLLETADGEEGWFKATECLPDIVVSDVMMPKMDGFQLCKKLKTDERTSHIPVILLTAKAATQDKIEGFETGADAYILKPFEPVELKARIKNLTEQRKRLHEHFRKHGVLSIDDSRLISIDRKFLDRVFHIIADNISNASFGVESLAEAAAVSRSVLHRKIVSLLGEPPVDLIRRLRLMRAAELIEKKFGNISEIAYEVGFTNPSYFSECFKKQFGASPSQYPSQTGNK